MFLDIDDYKAVCDMYEIEALQADADMRERAERAAIEEISSYTRHRYDMSRAFRARGEDRNPMLVQCCVNICLWLMVHRLPDSMGHERRERLYNDSVKWLKDIQASNASPDLPTYVSEDGKETDLNNPVRYGSQPPTRPTW